MNQPAMVADSAAMSAAQGAEYGEWPPGVAVPSAERPAPAMIADPPLSPACYEEVLRELPAGVILLDHRGRVRKSNPQAAELLGMPLRGQHWRDIVRRAFAPRLDDGHDVSLRNGRRVSISTQALATEPGQLLLINDVTENRRLQDRLGQRARLIGLGEMAAGLAHQIRTPLATALLYAPNLARPELSAEQRAGFVDRIAENLQHLDRLVEHMLIFARVGGFRCEPLDLGSILQDYETALNDFVRRHRGALELEVPAAPMPIYGNRDALLTALQNLTTNAVEACGEGARLQVRAVAEDGAYAVEVIDNGPGVPSELRERIFEPFLSRKAGGTGLGLAVVRAIARAHGGSITLAAISTPGSCFVLRIPSAHWCKPPDPKGRPGGR